VAGPGEHLRQVIAGPAWRGPCLVEYDGCVDGPKSDTGLLIILWVLGLAFLAFLLLAGIAGMTP
jgi:hypothetical protein